MAYGARLESVLGASPRGFESPILRHQSGTVRFRIFYTLFTPHPAFYRRRRPPPSDIKNPATHRMTGIDGGSAGIRTRGGLHHTAFRVLHLRPLGHATSAAQFTGDYSQYANLTYPAAFT